MSRVRVDPPRRRWQWWRHAAVLATLGVVSGLAWMAVGGLGRERAEPMATAASGVTPGVRAPGTQRSPATATGAATGSGVRPRVMAAAPSAARAQPDSDAIEVCGHGKLAQRDMDRMWPPEVVNEARGLVARAMLAGNEREQVVGWLLERSRAYDAVNGAAERACAENALCVGEQRRAPGSAAAAAVAPAERALVDLARRSRDPWVFATVMNYVCKPDQHGRDGCAGIGPEQWAERDPDNAAPWLWIAGRAAEQGQPAAAEAALLEAARRTQLSQYFAVTQSVLAEHSAMKALAPPLQGTLRVDLWGYSAAVPLPSMQTVVRFCAADKAGDPQRRETCGALVQRFSSDSATMLELLIGSRIAERMTLLAPEARRKLADERESLQSAHAAWVAPEQMMSCQGLERQLKYERDLMRLGEVGAMRASLAASGRPLEAWAAEARRSREAAHVRTERPARPDRP